MLEFLDSFEGYSTGEFPLRWKGAGGCTIVPGGRNGKGAIVPSGAELVQTVPYNSGWAVGFAFKINGGNVAAGGIYTALTPGASNLCQITVEADGSISLRSQASPVPIANSGINNYFISTGTWYYIDIMYTIQPTTVGGHPGVVLNVSGLRINKQTILSGSATIPWDYTNSLTQQAKLDQHLWGFSNGNPGSMTIDDLYIFNQDGTTNNAVVGDIKILIIEPNVDLAVPFSKVGGSGSSFSCINEVPPDYDTSYLFSNTEETFENFNWQHLPPFFGSVICVQYTIFARKDDEGSRAFQHTMGTGPDQLSSAHYIGDSYLYYMWELDTGIGGAQWTVALFNATSFGFKIFTIPIPS